MWKLYEAVNSTVSSFLTGMVTNESPEAIRLDHFKRLFDDSLQIINEMRECSETQRGDWIRTTNVEQDLKQMVDLLVEEETASKKETRESSDDSEVPGLCMDYVVKQHVIDTLCGIAMVDNPKGSTVLITTQLTRMFREVRYPLLSSNTTHITISALIQKFMQLYSQSISPELETAIIQFIEVLLPGPDDL